MIKYIHFTTNWPYIHSPPTAQHRNSSTVSTVGAPSTTSTLCALISEAVPWHLYCIPTLRLFLHVSCCKITRCLEHLPPTLILKPLLQILSPCAYSHRRRQLLHRQYSLLQRLQPLLLLQLLLQKIYSLWFRT